jgi:hypothetical protein
MLQEYARLIPLASSTSYATSSKAGVDEGLQFQPGSVLTSSTKSHATRGFDTDSLD